MAKIGFTLSSEECGPNELVRYAGLAERAGYDFLSISDHFHPWVDRQGNSPFVWSVLGGISQTTDSIRVGTGVTCPTTRMHPAIVAQAAATAATMLPGRFWLGIGSGENLNEHIVGQGWPETAVRQERMIEAIDVIRLLWQGGIQSHHGKHFTVENARIYTLPAQLPPIYVATAGDRATEIAAQHGDGMFGLVPDPSVIEAFERASDVKDKPKFGQVHVCLADSEDEAKRTALEWWPNAVTGGNLSWELPLPSHFESVTEWADEEAVAESIVCATASGPFIEAITEYVDAGYDHVYFHQVGPAQAKFLEFSEKELLPALADLRD
jgi:coenzyme F420-dependent glucose-6-phosphate dehydrogenase